MEWTPIEKGLPPIGTKLIVTIYDKIFFKRKLVYPVYYIEKPFENGYGFCVGNLDDFLNPEYSEVEAWMLVPTPYDYDNGGE